MYRSISRLYPEPPQPVGDDHGSSRPVEQMGNVVAEVLDDDHRPSARSSSGSPVPTASRTSSPWSHRPRRRASRPPSHRGRSTSCTSGTRRHVENELLLDRLLHPVQVERPGLSLVAVTVSKRLSSLLLGRRGERERDSSCDARADILTEHPIDHHLPASTSTSPVSALVFLLGREHALQLCRSVPPTATSGLRRQ